MLIASSGVGLTRAYTRRRFGRRLRKGPTVELRLETHNEGGWTVLDVQGEVDLSSAHTLRSRVDQLIHEGARRLVVDLGGVGFMDSSGLSALVTARKRMQEADGELAIVCRQESVLKVFTVTGLDRVFRIADSVAEATES